MKWRRSCARTHGCCTSGPQAKKKKAEANEWAFEETQGTDELLRRLLCGDWKGSDDFAVMTKANEETELAQVGDRMVLRVKEAQSDVHTI